MENGSVSWAKYTADSASGILEVSYPKVRSGILSGGSDMSAHWNHPLRWSRIRQTEGWAGLQHHSVLHTVLTVFPPSNPDGNSSYAPPRLHVNLVQGSFFTILPRPGDNSVPKWYSGNIYSMERSLPRIIDFPSIPSLIHPTTYDVFVSGDYEVGARHAQVFMGERGMSNTESSLDTALRRPTSIQWE